MRVFIILIFGSAFIGLGGFLFQKILDIPQPITELQTPVDGKKPAATQTSAIEIPLPKNVSWNQVILKNQAEVLKTIIVNGKKFTLKGTMYLGYQTVENNTELVNMDAFFAKKPWVPNYESDGLTINAIDIDGAYGHAKFLYKVDGGKLQALSYQNGIKDYPTYKGDVSRPYTAEYLVFISELMELSSFQEK